MGLSVLLLGFFFCFCFRKNGFKGRVSGNEGNLFGLPLVNSLASVNTQYFVE